MTGRQIQQAVNEIIRGRKRKDFESEAINWGDLRCTEVDEVISMIDGRKRIEVTIEEADPAAVTFCSIIRIRFREKYGIDISVHTEW